MNPFVVRQFHMETVLLVTHSRPIMQVSAAHCWLRWFTSRYRNLHTETYFPIVSLYASKVSQDG